MPKLDKYGVPYVEPINGLHFSCIIDGLDIDTEFFHLEMKLNQKISGEFSFSLKEGGLSFSDVYSYVKNVSNKTIKVLYLNSDNKVVNETTLINVEITKISQSVSFLQNMFFDFPVSVNVKFSAELDV